MAQIDDREVAEQWFAHPRRFLVCPARQNRAAHDPRATVECGMSVQQFLGPELASACVVIDEGDNPAECRRRAYVARIGKSRLRFDKIGEIGQAGIALSEARGTSLIRRVVDHDNLEQAGRNVLFYQRIDRFRQQVVPVVGADDCRQRDLAPLSRVRDRQAGAAICIRGRRHEGRQGC